MSTAATLSNVAAGVQSPASLSKVVAKENEWVAPQFHRKVHVNNRIYIEGAGIEKLGYERLTEYFNRWGKVYNVELKVNNRDGRRQKKVYGFVTFAVEGDAQNCIEAAKAGIEIEPGRPLSVRAAFFMPRRNSFDTDKVTTTNWSSQAPSEPTIPSRSPSPLFETGEWKPEMGKHYQGANGQSSNGHNSYKHLSEQDQAKKLFEIFQNLPDSTQTRILHVLMAQKYQEQQLAAITKDAKTQSFNSDSSGSSSGSETVPLDLTFANMSMMKPTVSPVLQNGASAVPPTTTNQNMPVQPSQLSQYQQEPIKNLSMPRYMGNDSAPRNEGHPVSQQQAPVIPAMSRHQPPPLYQRSYSDNSGYEQPQPPLSQASNYTGPSGVRPIKKILNDEGLSLTIPESFGASSPGVWHMPNSPPNDDYFMQQSRRGVDYY